MEAFGCDIGNGYGYVSILRNIKEDPVPMLPPKYHLTEGMPTDVYVTPPTGEPIMAFDMKRGCAMSDTIRRDGDRGIHAVKTRLHEAYIKIEGIDRPIQVDEAYAAIARDLIVLANEQRKNRGEAPLYDLVFTYPVAYEKDINLLNRMQKAIEGVKIDEKNLRVVGRCPEPAAVAIDYLFYVRNIKNSGNTKQKEYTVLVYDLGHGTFDAALVKVGEKVGEEDEPYRVLNQDGIPDVGGKDFDSLLYNEINRLLKDKYDFSPKTSQQKEDIRKLAIKTKHQLSKDNIYIAEYELPDDEEVAVEISRRRFEELAESKIRKTIEVIQRMLESAENDNEKVDAIVLSGGGSQMPMVEKALKQLVENELPIIPYRPSEAVSYGAARYASGIHGEEKVKSPSNRSLNPKESNSVLEQKTSYAYGMALGTGGEVEILIPSETKLPAASKAITMNSKMGRLDIKIYRSINKGERHSRLANNSCESVIFLPFDLPVDTNCQFTLTVEEDLNVSVICKLPDGVVQKRGTADWLGNGRV